MKDVWLVAIFMVGLFVCLTANIFGCADDDEDNSGSDSDTDADTDGDADSDGDSDGDRDTDTEGDSDTQQDNDYQDAGLTSLCEELVSCRYVGMVRFECDKIHPELDLECWNMAGYCDPSFLCATQEQACSIACFDKEENAKCYVKTSLPPQVICEIL